MTAEWVRVDLDAVEKYGADAAVVLGLIAYRCNLTGDWSATLDTLVAETRLTTHRVRAALRVLRDTGAVESRRADRFHPLLTWTVSPGHAVNQDSCITRISTPASPVVQDSCITSYTEPQELPLEVPAAPKRKRARSVVTSLPADFRPSPAHWELARSLGVNLTHEGPQFVDHHTAKGSTFKDWDAALRTWIRNAAKYAAQRGEARPAPTDDAYDPVYEATLPPPRTDPFAPRAGAL